MNVTNDNVNNKDTDILHVSSGLQYCAGDKSQYFLLLNMFLDSAEKRIQELNQFCLNADLENYSIKVHALKSTSRGLGADLLADCAYEHELKSKAGDLDFVSNDWERLLDLWNKTIVDMRYYVNEFDESVGFAADSILIHEEISVEEQNRYMSEIKKDVANFNFADASSKIERLMGFILPDDLKNRLTLLAKAVNNFDYIKSAELLGIE